MGLPDARVIALAWLAGFVIKWYATKLYAMGVVEFVLYQLAE